MALLFWAECHFCVILYKYYMEELGLHLNLGLHLQVACVPGCSYARVWVCQDACLMVCVKAFRLHLKWIKLILSMILNSLQTPSLPQLYCFLAPEYGPHRRAKRFGDTGSEIVPSYCDLSWWEKRAGSLWLMRTPHCNGNTLLGVNSMALKIRFQTWRRGHQHSDHSSNYVQKLHEPIDVEKHIYIWGRINIL